jgi:integrase
MTVLSREADAGNLETARRMRTVIGEVFRYAIQHGIVEHDPVAATRGAIATPTPKHFAAILYPEAFGGLLRQIDDYAARNVVTGSALQLMALLYPRPGELRQAQWSEFDLAKCTWEIPASRMKLRQPHTKALPRQAVAILKALYKVTGPSGKVFPAVGRAARPLSENTMNAALRRMGVKASEHSSHGFRATASTLLNASNMFSADAIEHSLAHQDKDAVRRAYARGDAMTERKKMAQWWADYLDRLRNGGEGKVVHLRA